MAPAGKFRQAAAGRRKRAADVPEQNNRRPANGGAVDSLVEMGQPRQACFLPLRPGVIWFYERNGERLRCEIRQQVEGDRFALVVTLPDGTERVEMFDDSYALNRRSLELEQMLSGKGWQGPFARDL